MQKILMIEDDIHVVQETMEYFQDTYTIRSAGTLKDGEYMLYAFKPDLILLDVILPDGNGIDFLKNTKLNIPVIILTTMNIDSYHIDGLSYGATDFLIKPISLPVLEKHIQIRLQKDERFLVSGKLNIDLTKRTVNYDEKPVLLTATEFDILVFLFKNSENYHTAEEIYESLFNDVFLQSTTIKMHLSHLRNKLLTAAPNETFISTMYGKGYRFLKA